MAFMFRTRNGRACSFAHPLRAMCALALPLGAATPLLAQEAEPESGLAAREIPAEPTGPIEFEADNIDYNFDAEIVTASGNVILIRDGYRLQAEEVVWNRTSGEVVASGNVRARGPEGDLAYGDRVTLTDTLRDGVIENLLVVIEDGGRLAAREGVRDGDLYVLRDAAYSPCEVETDSGCPKEPTWQIKANSVTYDAATGRVRYEGARVELFGLPVVPLPFLKHRIGSGADSGFLVPDLSFSDSNGAEFAQPYYLRLSPNRDLTLTGHLYTKVAPMVGAQYRALNDIGSYQVSGYVTSSSRANVAATGPLNLDRELRGYFDTSGQFQISPNWTLSHSVRVASDRTFLRRYDITREDRLRSTFSAERIDQDSYFALTGWAVQTLRAGDVQGQIPVALPELDYRRRMQEPWLGGTAQIQVNSLAIGRTDGQDTQRAFASVQWDLRKMTNMGQEINFTLLGRGDVYHSDENALSSTLFYRGRSGWQGRGVFAAAVDVRWPFIGEMFGGTHILTPRVQLVAAPNVSNLRIPNEDSRAVDLEDSNLFSLNRFPGYDRFEDNYRITLGLDWVLRTGDFTVDATVGQSVRLSDKGSIFPDGTGLSDRVSDFVGRTVVKYKNLIKFTHRFRLDKDNLSVRRNEIDATVGTRGTYAKVGYIRLNRDVSATLEDLRDREEIRLGGRVTLFKNWSLFGSTIIDLTSTDEEPLSIADGYEPIRHRVGISYDDECLSLGLTWRRDYEQTGDARRGNTILFRLAFRQLGV